MTSGARLLVALAAVLAPGQATRLLDRLHDPDGQRLRDEASRLAGAPREARLAALRRALAALSGSAAEPPRLVLRRRAEGPPPSVPRTAGRQADDGERVAEVEARPAGHQPGAAPADATPPPAARPLARRVDSVRP